MILAWLHVVLPIIPPLRGIKGLMVIAPTWSFEPSQPRRIYLSVLYCMFRLEGLRLSVQCTSSSYKGWEGARHSFIGHQPNLASGFCNTTMVYGRSADCKMLSKFKILFYRPCNPVQSVRIEPSHLNKLIRFRLGIVEIQNHS